MLLKENSPKEVGGGRGDGREGGRGEGRRGGGGVEEKRRGREGGEVPA